MSTRTILALAAAVGLLSATAAMAQTTTSPAGSAPGTGASSGSSPANSMPPGANNATAPATASQSAGGASLTPAPRTSSHHVVMRHTPMHHVMPTAAHSRTMHVAPSRDSGGDAAVDQLNAQSLARARGQTQ